MTDPEVQCHVRHIRQAKLCMAGARSWFKLRGWDWWEFIVDGRPSGDFIATGDPLALRMVEAAAKEQGNG